VAEDLTVVAEDLTAAAMQALSTGAAVTAAHFAVAVTSPASAGAHL
jgi:hypothetical protein